MARAVGTRLGSYEVLAPLGAGGMGEVYRARDRRLEREVAVKVLPSQFAEDADRRTRFQREAKAVASLNQPNILAIHDYDVADGVAYAVTELLEGDTLRELLSGSPLSTRRALEYAVQIARGLAAAHEKGVVQRSATCRPSRCAAKRQTRARTSSRSVSCSTRCCRDGVPSGRRRRPRP